MPAFDPSKYKLVPEKEHLVLNNQRLIAQIIKDHFSTYYEYYDDMMQEGSIGLIKAAAKYIDDGRAKFSSYAYFCIKNEIQRFVSERTDNIKVPVTLRMCLNTMQKEGIAINELDNDTHSEMLKRYQTNANAVKCAEVVSSVASLDKPVESTEDICLKDVIQDPRSEITPELLEGNEYRITRLFVSELHDWLNKYYEEDLLYNRIFVNYIYWYDKEEKFMQRISKVAKELGVSRNLVKEVILIYNDRFKRYLKATNY